MAKGKPTPPGYCYVHNFTSPDRPQYLQFPHDNGRAFRDEVQSLVQERIQDMMQRGTLLVDTEGATVGQVNGLAVVRA